MVNHIYLMALFEFIWNNYHNEINLPSYDSIWYLEGDPDCYDKLQFLKYLMNEHYLFDIKPVNFINIYLLKGH